MLLFHDYLEECGLIDLGFTGPKYTWTNKHDANNNIRVRLDRAVGNGALQAMFDDYRVENVITTSSDHLAISISLGVLSAPVVQAPVQSGFRFQGGLAVIARV